MAYYCDPRSYANTFYGAPFSRRRPSPPPATYYPREAYDPYIQALAEEQAARAALQDAARREREARQRLAEEQAKAQMRERAKREARARQRPQSYFGYPSGYGYPGYGYRNYDDEDDEIYDYPYFTASRQEPFQAQNGPNPGSARSKSHSPDNRRYQRPAEQTNASKVTIPIVTPSKKPEPSDEQKNSAASKIQSAFRAHAAHNSINAARGRFKSLVESFNFPETLDFDFSAPPQSDDERPKLTYASRNAPVHGHEDALLRLLQTLDAIESHGDPKVRDARRELVREIEAELGHVDAEVRRRWEDAVKSHTADSNSEAQPQASGNSTTEGATTVEDSPMDEAERRPAATEEAEETIPTDDVKMDEVDTTTSPSTSNVRVDSTEAQMKPFTEPMDVEPDPSTLVDQETMEDITIAKEPFLEDPQAAESPGESEVQTPPHVSLPSQPTIYTPEPEPRADMPPHVVIAIHSGSESELNSKDAEPYDTPLKPSSHSDSPDVETEEELVVVDPARSSSPLPPSPVATEKDFIMV